MPDVSGLAALDVAIGLIFVYFVLSIACSSINETIASALGLRAKNLQKGIESLLGDADLAKRFYEHPRIQALMRPGSNRPPSYIPPRIVAETLIDTLAASAGADAADDPLTRAEGAVDRLGDSRAKVLLSDALTRARGERDTLHASLERSFGDVMERAGGWYKRRVQLILLVLAVVLVGAANADTFSMAERLWKDDALRAAVVTQATQEQGATRCEAVEGETNELARTARCIDEVKQLGIPLGWSDEAAPDDGWGIAGKILGLLVTVAAVSLGAPFWFDLLGKVSRLRAAGGRPEGPTAPAGAPPKDTATAAVTDTDSDAAREDTDAARKDTDEVPKDSGPAPS